MKMKYNLDIVLPNVKDILEVVKGYYPTQEVIIAGGWVRDIIYKEDPKDIDVFIMDCKPDITFQEDYPTLLFGHMNNHIANSSYLQMREDVLVLQQFSKGIDILFMKPNDISDLLSNSFDTSICECGVILGEDNELYLYTSDRFEETIKTGVTAINTWHEFRSDRELRLKRKFPNMTFKSIFSNTTEVKYRGSLQDYLQNNS